MRGRLFSLVVTGALALAGVGSAQAAMDWRPEQTVDVVRGMPRPDVAVAENGRAALLFSNANFGDHPRLELYVRRENMPEAFIPGAALAPGGATDASLVMSPGGVTAVAALDAGRLFVTMYPANVSDRYRGKIVEIDSPGPADTPLIAIDAASRATVVWASPRPVGVYGYGDSRPRQVYAVTVSPDGVPGPVEPLGEPGICDPDLDVNLRGDAVVAVSCSDRDDLVFQRAPGGAFGSGERPFERNGTLQVALDGAGTVHVLQTYMVTVYHGKYPDGEFRLAYAVRPAGGGFGPVETVSRPSSPYVSPVDLEVQEDGRAIAGWVDGDRFLYAVRSTGGAFGSARTAAATFRPAALVARDTNPFGAIDVVASPHGPVLLAWRELATSSSDRIRAAILEPGGTLTDVFRGVLAPQGSWAPAPAFAINDAGQAAGAWEQRCAGPAGGVAVMAVQRDVDGSPRTPPCQDQTAPRAIVVRKRVGVRGRTLRVRLACDEVCYFTASARVLRAGKRKPIATSKTRRESRLAERRGGWARLPLSGAEVRRIARAERAGRKVTVRLGVAVRDRYGTGRTWRFRVPLG
jgi:hypothetical protein